MGSSPAVYTRPVIVTAVGGLPEVVDDGVTGYVIPRQDPDALSEAITRFYLQGDLRKMEENIAASKDRFSWARCKSTLLGMAEKLASRSGTVQG